MSLIWGKQPAKVLNTSKKDGNWTASPSEYGGIYFAVIEFANGVKSKAGKPMFDLDYVDVDFSTAVFSTYGNELWFIAVTSPETHGTLFEFQNNDEGYKQWVDSGCVVAARCTNHIQLKTIAEKLNDNDVLTTFLRVFTEPKPLPEDLNPELEDYLSKQREGELPDLEGKSAKLQELGYNPFLLIDAENDLKSAKLSAKRKRYPFMTASQANEKFTGFSKSSGGGGGFSKSGGYFKPEDRLKFVIDTLNKAGIECNNVADITSWAVQSEHNWITTLLTLNISGAYEFGYMPLGFPEPNTESESGNDVVEESETHHGDFQYQKETSGSSKFSFEEWLKNYDTPGQIPKDWTVDSINAEPNEVEEWCTVFNQIKDVVDISDRNVKAKAKRINKDIKSIVELNLDELSELRNQVMF